MAIRDYIAKYVADLTGYDLRPAIKSTEQLDAATKKTTDDIVSDWKRTGTQADNAATQYANRVLGSFTKSAKKGAKNAGKTLGQGLVSNIGTSIGSVQSTSDIAGAVSSTLSGALAAVPGFGLAASAGVLVGSAIVTSIVAARSAAEKAAHELGLSIAGQLGDGILSSDEIKQDLTKLLNADDFSDAVDKIAHSARDAEVPVNDFYKAVRSADPHQIDTLSDSYRGLAKQTEDAAKVATGDTADVLFKRARGYGELADALDLYSGGLKQGATISQETKQALAALGIEIDNTTDATKDNTEATKRNVEALSDWANEALGVAGAEDDLRKAETDAIEAAGKHNKHVKDFATLATDKRQALEHIASAALDLASAEDDAGTSAFKIGQDLGKARAAFIRTATQMGLSKAAAKALADQFGLIPKKVDTTVDMKAPTKAQVSAVHNRAQEDLDREGPLKVGVTAVPTDKGTRFVLRAVGGGRVDYAGGVR